MNINIIFKNKQCSFQTKINNFHSCLFVFEKININMTIKYKQYNIHTMYIKLVGRVYTI